jgi:hypothetical protein
MCDNSNLNSLEPSSHESDMRIAFDAMRAYHNSEIAHKKDAVDILKTVLTIIVLVYGSLIGLVFSNKVGTTFTICVLIGLFLFILISIIVIIRETNKKIDMDHERYMQYLNECIAERKILKIDKDLEKQKYDSPWDISYRPGYKYTKKILGIFGTIIVLVAFIGSVFVISILLTNKNTGKKKFPAFHHHHPHKHYHPSRYKHNFHHLPPRHKQFR